jgi:RND family efflux transporter MFP subunit
MLICSGLLVFYFVTNKRKAGRRKPVALVPKVQVQEIKSTNIQVEIPATGLVIPSREADIRARVSGEIIKLHKDLEPGGILKKDEPVIWLDDKDYRLKLNMRNAMLQKAEAALQLELVQQRIAEKEFNTYKYRDNNDNIDRDMILRKPQERSSRADVQIAESELKDAELDLQRTVIKAPFNSVVLEEDVDIGEQADLQRVLVTLAGVDTFWVKVSIPVRFLKWIIFPDEKRSDGSEVTIYTKRGEKTGKVMRRFTQLESQGRMAQILVEVKDPLGLKQGSKDSISLIIGEYVKIKIKGEPLQNVVRIPRKAYRDNAKIWLLNDDSKLEIIDVEPVWSLRDYVFINKSDLPEGKIILSDLAFPVENMSLSPAVSRKENEQSKEK